jgi:16S rRNA (guanine(966)-N(2))-methyltransferase RsmD
MRITGGTWSGRPIKATPGMDARPTTDKVRQSIFNILMNDIEGKTVLDLFAGSGALGIEALSRGATKAVFIEIGRAQANAIRGNLCSLGVQAEIIETDFRKGLRQLSEEGRKFDIIMADPPYAKVTPREVIDAVLQYDLLEGDGFLIIEHISGAVTDDERLTILKKRKYGQTEVTFYGRKENR